MTIVLDHANTHNSQMTHCVVDPTAVLARAASRVSERGIRNALAGLVVEIAADREWAGFLRSVVCCDEEAGPAEAVALRERGRWRPRPRKVA